MTDFKTTRGRRIVVVGEPSVLTLDRITAIGDRFDSDPRIATVSVVSHPRYSSAFLRSTAPSGCLVAFATDAIDLVGDIPIDDISAWSTAASERGLWHDWWLTNARDVARAEILQSTAELDAREAQDPSSAHFLAITEGAPAMHPMSVNVDITWLGEHQTGARVLATAAIAALAEDDRISHVGLFGRADLPSYATHLMDLSKVDFLGESPERADICWYPNQIDHRSSISDARLLGRRVITTYLDMIAYDVPRYHASVEAWETYRALQRKIALSVDGITTISADVATRLLREVPRLDPERVRPIPLGLDHVTDLQVPNTPDMELKDLGSRPFVLVLGNDFLHKNRDFAIAVWEQVLRSGQSCDLVLAGLHTKSSSSRDREEALLARHIDLRGTAHVLGHVTPDMRAWLLANAAAVLYPSSAEGFGFVPYEAATLGTPSTFTRFGPLAEISNVTDVPRFWEVDAFAQDIVRLLGDKDAAMARVHSLQQAVAVHSWRGFSDQLIDFFAAISGMPTVLTSTMGGGSAAESAALTAVLSSKTWRATEPLRRVGRKLRRP